MKVELDVRDLAKYPFLKESQDLIGGLSLEPFLESDLGKRALERAVERVMAAIRSRHETPDEQSMGAPPTDITGVKLEVAGYALARVLVSCSGERFLMDRLARYEAERAFGFLEEERDSRRRRTDDSGIRDYVAESLSMNLAKREMPVIQYVELVPFLREDRWRLVNREVRHGMVSLEGGDMEELLKERLFSLIRRQLPLRVPQPVCVQVGSHLQKVTAEYQQQMLEEFGDVKEESFPPCIQALSQAITSGANLPHTGRFALTAFLHTIGMNSQQIVELYCRAPDFDISKTQYQVEHISGRSGTEYTPPSCATMRTYGLCVNKDELCGRINHPLSYYRIKKKREMETSTKDAESR